MSDTPTCYVCVCDEDAVMWFSNTENDEFAYACEEHAAGVEHVIGYSHLDP